MPEHTSPITTEDVRQLGRTVAAGLVKLEELVSAFQDGLEEAPTAEAALEQMCIANTREPGGPYQPCPNPGTREFQVVWRNKPGDVDGWTNFAVRGKLCREHQEQLKASGPPGAYLRGVDDYPLEGADG